MLILVPWKPIIIVWGLLAAMLWVGYVGSSLLEGKNPFSMELRHSHYLHAHRTASQDLTSEAFLNDDPVPAREGCASESLGLNNQILHPGCIRLVRRTL
jgi:hypothetical protein